ncbi:uncharacterized protein DUF3558 [Amycolatopsis echigonensis]|uniref:Uncharacterized protein DUF3558 n=1 Tax=Amycolatopsis echigonensis TaxID=2576905 RepID=A0A2N3WGF2_9PSEU|nr:uncharacterized protein DUF3558 [Amycolatopsis niigatensis]
MRSTRFRIPLLTLALAAGLVACSGNGGKADPPGQSLPGAESPSSNAQQPASDTPKIANPLPASLVQGDPCKVLTDAQVKTLFSGVSPAVQPSQDTGVAKQCRWSNPSRGSGIGVQLVYAWKDGLGHVYAKKNEGFFKELAPVQGYPVVAYGPSDDRATGRCSVAVGIADDAAFEVDVKLANDQVGSSADPCQDAQHVADLAVITLKAGA